MGSAQLEAQYLNQLVKDTVKALGLKQNGTVLGIGEGQWEFAKLCFAEFGENAKSLLVADKDAEVLKAAESAGVPMTSTADIKDFEAVIVSRLRPTLPLPASVLSAWSEALPDAAGFAKEAEECGFTPTALRLAYPAALDTAVWKAHLLHGGGTRPIPFIEKADKDEIEKFAASHGDKITFKDEIDIIVLHKIIKRVPKED